MLPNLLVAQDALLFQQASSLLTSSINEFRLPHLFHWSSMTTLTSNYHPLLMLSGTGHIRGFQWPLGWQETVWPPAAVPSFHSQTEAFISLPERRPSLGPMIMVIFSAQGPFASDQRLQRCLRTPLCLQSPAPYKPPSLKPGAIIGSRRQVKWERWCSRLFVLWLSKLVETSCFKGSGLAPPTSWKHKGGSLLKRPVKNQRLHCYLMAQLTWHTKGNHTQWRIRLPHKLPVSVTPMPDARSPIFIL